MVLNSKRIVITGGSMGIGFAVAKACVREGAEVIIASRSKDELERSVSELNGVSGRKNHAYPVDVGAPDQVEAFSKWCRNTVQSIHGLVNCAGIYGPIGKTPELDMELFRKTVQINFLGTVAMCHAFYSCFDGTGVKKIVNYSGGGAASPFPNYSAYAASKAAVVRFTENLSLELKEDAFDVNCVAPGFVATRLHRQTLQAGAGAAGSSFYENTKKQIEQGGVSPEIAAELTVFLLSGQSDGITGKFLSAPWDPWRDEAFRERLRKEQDFCTMRRIDGKNFEKREA